MDRLETTVALGSTDVTIIFTFQYGQIRNDDIVSNCSDVTVIYIPVWIDQKLFKVADFSLDNIYLHSSMDRLETND